MWGGVGGAEFIPQSHTLPDPLFCHSQTSGFHQPPSWQASLFSGLQMLNTIYWGGWKKSSLSPDLLAHMLTHPP